MKRLLLIVAVMASAILGANAQAELPEKYGVDPAMRENNAKNLSYMQFAYNSKAYDEALVFFRKLVVDAPKASMNMYIWASEIYRGKLARSVTKEERNLYLDTILVVLDKRIENFGDHEKYNTAYLMGQKALIFNETNSADHQKAFDLFRNAIKVSGRQVDPDLVVTFFNSLTEAFKLDDISPENYILDYENLTVLLSELNTDQAKASAETLGALFAASGAASCENIERIFRPKYEADPENIALVKQILALFTRSKCSGEFQMSLVEKFYAIEPTAELAGMLASVYDNGGLDNKAADYYKVAIAGEDDADRKFVLILAAANSALEDKQYRNAADYARQAISIDDAKAGVAYMILADSYAGGARATCSSFDLAASYWLVVDTYTQARARLSDQPNQVEYINKAIGSYASNFPKTEDVFLRNLTPGQGYTVNCGWVSGRTTVRER